jgi:phenylacetate-CoA ligase
MALEWDIESALPGAEWPAVPQPGSATLLALQFQLEQTQWLAAEVLARLQLTQLAQVVAHAYKTVPHYRERWSGQYNPSIPLTWQTFSRLPLLTRSDLRSRFDRLKSARIPAQHGAVSEARTSGSTGAPVCVLKTELCGLFWGAFTLREHAWHRRDLNGKLVAIRQGVQREEGEGWGAATQGLVRTGRAATLPVGTEVREQLQWVQLQNPDYLLTHPSNLGALAQLSIRRGVRLPRLRQARTSGEVLTPEVRELCREAWGVAVADMYSTNEVGYVALQCAESGSYHVMAEGVVVEVIDDAGMPCAPGQTGRIVVSCLHNFSTPLIRYEIGDYAEVGEPCSCGRGLPVLKRIMGRVRNMLLTADGRQFWPSFGMRKLAEMVPLLQHQLVQKEFDLIEARLVIEVPLTAAQEEEVRQQFLSKLPPGFRLQITYRDAIPRSAGGKFEDFISEVALPAV